eukprot:350796-Chlamydomonas_euryale.AAC.3
MERDAALGLHKRVSRHECVNQALHMALEAADVAQKPALMQRRVHNCVCGNARAALARHGLSTASWALHELRAARASVPGWTSGGQAMWALALGRRVLRGERLQQRASLSC